jgi:ArsR family transcriptional regulator, lead/cadmium/zinc/bismuth-responsive transcriptional repressor
MSYGELLHLDADQGARLRAARPAPDRADALAGSFRALGDPTRVALALSLRGGRELCVCDLSWIAERPQNLVSHHMKVLKAGGVVRSRRDGKMTMYALTEQGRALLGAMAAATEADAPS